MNVKATLNLTGGGCLWDRQVLLAFKSLFWGTYHENGLGSMPKFLIFRNMASDDSS